MQPNADAHRDAGWPDMGQERPLHGHGCRYSIAGAGKHHEESIALRVDLVAMMLSEGAAQ
jgi:hypothetical protein